MSHKLIIEKISVKDVVEDDNNKTGKYNTNNHWVDNTPPPDYYEFHLKVYTKEWIDKFHTSYVVINIDVSDLRWMRDATKIGMLRETVSELYRDFLDTAAKKYESRLPQVFNGTDYFVRTEKVSLKCGIHGKGPYKNMKTILESLVTAQWYHTPVNQDTKELKLYLLPWKNIEYFKEFRVFVHNQHITAISQQHLYKANVLLTNEDNVEEIIKHWMNLIYQEFENDIVDKLTSTKSYVIDLAIIGNDVYFIEINNYGKEYGSGSALFNWIEDEYKLTYHEDKKDKIFFRYCA